MKPNYKRPFAQYVKKAHKPLQLAIEDAVWFVCDSPDIGEPQVGDLAGIRVYKFRFNRQEYSRNRGQTTFNFCQPPDPQTTEGATTRNPRRSKGLGGFAVSGAALPAPTFAHGIGVI